MLRLILIFLFGLSLASRAEALPQPELFDKLKAAPSAEEAAGVAEDIFAGWLESGSATVDVLMQRAFEAQSFGDTATARGLFDRVLLIKPNYAEAWNRRAAIFLNEQNTAEALRDLNEALKHEPRHFGAWTGLGIVFENMGADKQALEAYREALKIYPTLPQAQEAATRLARKLEGEAL